MSWCWYGVKSIYETRVSAPEALAEGRAENPSERLVEERVVLLRARSTDEAMTKAEEEARRYGQGIEYRNGEGDLVDTRYLGAIDVFTIHGEPESGKEVYSSHRIVRASVANEELLDILLGPQTPEEAQARRKYEPDLPE